MQSESFTASTTATEELSPPRTETSPIQHGSLQHDETGIGLDSQPDSRSGSPSAAARPPTHTESGLSDGSNTGRKSRVQEYESSSVVANAGHTSGPMFQVVRNTRSAGIAPDHTIAVLPNEILTHVLAHLSPSDLATTALVSRRFHELVTTPHAWRSAFARYFPGPEAIEHRIDEDDDDSQAIVRSERRAFTRLTSKASWRSEYVLRTRLLRSLSRGKPMQAAQVPTARTRVVLLSPEVTYSTDMFSSINHLHASWIVGPNSRVVKLVHGADDTGVASASDASTGKMDKWGRSDPQTFWQFSDRAGDTPYGLGPGDIVGCPNSMDLSQTFGLLYGEGFPGGSAYYRASEEQRGRFLAAPGLASAPRLGAPSLVLSQQCVTAVWLAKSTAIPVLTDGLIGMLCGFSSGVLAAYSAGATSPSTKTSTRHERGEMTACWALSPGVPLIAIAVDDEYSMKRQAQNRIWAIVLNALGEVYYLTKFPRQSTVDKEFVEHRPWITGRSVYFSLVEPSRRVARPDPYDDGTVDGSYSPRSSWNGMCLGAEQIAAETVEVQTFIRKKPKDFQKACFGWAMRRKVVVDFAGDDEHNAGETVVIVDCGVDGGSASLTRYSRARFHEKQDGPQPSTPSLTSSATPASSSPSLFGGGRSPILAQPTPFSIDSGRMSPVEPLDRALTPRPLVEDWRIATFQLGGLKKLQITTCAIDESNIALQTQSEDPLLNFADASVTSSPSLGSWAADGSADSVDIPGQRARLFAVGTNTGAVLVWNIREHDSSTSETSATIPPIRIIHTDSPQISSLALTSLYLVHGGSDGLVQAWDLLASDTQPVRTLHSRFSSRARRQLIQAQASVHGVGVNMYAAGAITLDPDPSVLRGVVALGNKIRYWAYSSSAADQYKSSKRRLRRGEQAGGQAGDKFLGTARTNLKAYIANERWEVAREKEAHQKDAERIASRFGTELLGGSEAEMIAYAAMLSEESHAVETLRRSSDATDTGESTTSGVMWSSDTAPSPATAPVAEDEEMDADLAEAIRQSLSSTPAYEIAVRPVKAKGRKSMPITPASPSPPGASRAAEQDDMDFAIQLSLAEQASKVEASEGGVWLGAKGKQRQL